jgi:hypothetical protein
MTSFKKKAILGLVACLAVAAILLVVAFMPMNSERWDAVRDRTLKLKLEALTRKMPREVLRGKPILGNAWEEYNIALSASWPADAENGGVFFMFAKGNADKPERVREMVAEQLPLLDHLRLGAQRSDGQYPYKWELGEEVPRIIPSRMLANLAIAQARILTENGKPEEAAEVLLDVTVFARDLATNGPLLTNLVGMAVYYTAFEAFGDLVLSGKLTQKQLADLAEKLATVERDFPTHSAALSNELLGIGRAVLLQSSGEEYAGLQARAKQGGWRYAAFPQTTILEAFEQSEAFIQRFEKVDPTNYAAAKRELDAASLATQGSPNPIVRDFVPDMSRIMVARLEALATLRLVRAGTLLRATGKVPALADPFGTNLLFKQEGPNLKIWSIGPDGKDDNGSGEWGVFRPDMVLKIPR